MIFFSKIIGDLEIYQFSSMKSVKKIRRLREISDLYRNIKKSTNNDDKTDQEIKSIKFSRNISEKINLSYSS